MWSYIRRSYQSTTKIGPFLTRYNKIRPFETYSIFAKQDACISASTLSYFSLSFPWEDVTLNQSSGLFLLFVIRLTRNERHLS